eukprot:g28857.t1
MLNLKEPPDKEWENPETAKWIGQLERDYERWLDEPGGSMASLRTSTELKAVGGEEDRAGTQHRQQDTAEDLRGWMNSMPAEEWERLFVVREEELGQEFLHHGGKRGGTAASGIGGIGTAVTIHPGEGSEEAYDDSGSKEAGRAGTDGPDQAPKMSPFSSPISASFPTLIIQPHWMHEEARCFTEDEKKDKLTCKVCTSGEFAVGMLTHAPDHIQLWEPVPACDVCIVQPQGWPDKKTPDLKGDARGTLGHTVFAVAVDTQYKNFGAFTTIPISQNQRHRGMFFDGEVSYHPRGRGSSKHEQRSPHDPPMYAGVDAETPTSHWMPWDGFWRIDGRELLKRYKALQAEILGEVLAEHDGSWERFNARDGKSIVFHLPPGMRYKGSAQLVNSKQRERRCSHIQSSIP